MNRTFLALAATLFVSAQLFAQKTYNATPKSGTVNNTVQQATDTLYGDFFNGTPALYKSQPLFPGYASGNNAFGDLAKVQVYGVSNICAVEGVIMWAGYKNQSSGDVNSGVRFNLYDLKSTATGQGATALKLSPDSVIRTKTISLSSIDTSSIFESGANIVLFDTPAYFDTLFAVGFDFSALTQGDTIACYTTTNTDADSSENSWEQVADSSWSTMLNNWGLDIDFAIFPIIDGTATYISTVLMQPIQIWPNPATDVVNITPRDNKTVNITIVDNMGKMVLTYNNISTSISVNSLPTGIYYIIVNSSQKTGYAQKLIIK